MKNSISPDLLFPYLFKELTVLDHVSNKTVTLSGYTPKKGFVHGLSEFRTDNFTPYFRSILSLASPDADGSYPIIKLFGAAMGTTDFRDGKITKGLQVGSNNIEEGKHFSFVSYETEKEQAILYFSLGENVGFGLYIQHLNRKEVLPILNLEKLLNTAFDMHVWTGDQNVFSSGAAIELKPTSRQQGSFTIIN